MQNKAKPPPWSDGGFLTDCGLAATQRIGPDNRLGPDILQEYGRMAAAHNPAAIDRGWLHDRSPIEHPMPLGWVQGRGAGIAVLDLLEHLDNVWRFVTPCEKNVFKRLQQAFRGPKVGLI